MREREDPLSEEEGRVVYFDITETSKFIFRRKKILSKLKKSGRWQFEDFPDRNDLSFSFSSVTEAEDCNDIYFD